MEGTKEVVDVLSDESKLYNWPTIVAILLLSVVMLGLLDVLILKDLLENSYARGVSYLVTVLGVLGFWFYKRAQVTAPTISETSKALKIAMAIVPDGPEAKSLLLNDFSDAINKQISASRLQDLIEWDIKDEKTSKKAIGLIEILEKHRSIPRKPEVIDTTREGWQKVHSVLRADFYYWGKLYRFEDKYVLDFKGFVDENLEPELQKGILHEYAALGIEKRILDKGDALTRIQIDAQYFYIIARHIVAMVAFYSGRRAEAIRLDKSLEEDLINADDFAAKNTLLLSLKKRLSAEHFLESRILMSQGKTVEAERELEVAKTYDPTNSNVYMFAGANAFILRRDLTKAWQNIQKAKEYADPTATAWKYSVAFLLLAKEEHKKALELYEDIFAGSFQNEEFIVEQVIGFNEAILEKQDPKFVPALFVVPLVKGKKQGKYAEAIGELNEFLESIGGAGKYQILRKAALKYRSEFKHQLDVERSAERIGALGD